MKDIKKFENFENVSESKDIDYLKQSINQYQRIDYSMMSKIEILENRVKFLEKTLFNLIGII